MEDFLQTWELSWGCIHKISWVSIKKIYKYIFTIKNIFLPLTPEKDQNYGCTCTGYAIRKRKHSKDYGSNQNKSFFFLSQITEEFCIGFIYIHIEK